MKFAVKQHPELSKMLKRENIGKMIQSVYETVMEFITNIFNGGTSTADNYRRISTNAIQLARPMVSFSKHAWRMFMQDGAHSRIKRATNQTNAENDFGSFDDGNGIMSTGVNSVGINTILSLAQTFLKPKRDVDSQFDMRKQNLDENKDFVPDDDTIDFQKMAPEEVIDDLFDVESRFLERIGIDVKNMKKYSLMYCTKNYVIAYVERLVESFVMLI